MTATDAVRPEQRIAWIGVGRTGGRSQAKMLWQTAPSRSSPNSR